MCCSLSDERTHLLSVIHYGEVIISIKQGFISATGKIFCSEPTFCFSGQTENDGNNQGTKGHLKSTMQANDLIYRDVKDLRRQCFPSE